MSSLLQVHRVQYLIDEDKEESEPLARLYFCIYCLALRSADTLQLEIDSHVCPQTLDGLPSADAAMKRNKSANSWQCPACLHALSTRATSSILPSADDPTKPTTKKSYYQCCTFCRWTSRGVGMPDKEVVTGNWYEKENPNQSRIQNLVDHYKYMAMKESAELAQKKSTKKRGYSTVAMQLQQKYGGPRTLGKKHPAVASPLSSSLSALRLKETLKEVAIDPSETIGLDDVEKLPEDIYTREIDFTKIASINQRLDQPGYQPTEVAEFWPRKSTMFVKRSLRCKTCTHNIIKPEYNSSSIKFKIQLIAVLHIPEVRIYKAPRLFAGERTCVCLSLTNPTEHVLHVTLLPHLEGNKVKRSNAQVELPACDLIVTKYDVAAEYGSISDGNNCEIGEDNPDVIAFRSANKIGFYIHCTPDASLSPGDEVWVSFRFKHEHYSTASMQQTQPEETWLSQTVYVNLGKLVDPPPP